MLVTMTIECVGFVFYKLPISRSMFLTSEYVLTEIKDSVLLLLNVKLQCILSFFYIFYTYSVKSFVNSYPTILLLIYYIDT